MLLKDAIFEIKVGEFIDIGPGLNRIFYSTDDGISWESDGLAITFADIIRLGKYECKIIPAEPKPMTPDDLFYETIGKIIPGDEPNKKQIINYGKKCIQNGELSKWLQFKKAIEDAGVCPQCGNYYMDEILELLNPTREQ